MAKQLLFKIRLIFRNYNFPLQGGVRSGLKMKTKREILPYNPKLKELARQLRKNSTLSEILLWQQLHKKKILGYDFDRQRPILNYIVDLYCKDLKLAIEIDGYSHEYDESHKADAIRQKEIEKLGVHFLRFKDKQIKHDIYNVLYEIETWIEHHTIQPTPNPSKEGKTT